MGNTNLLVFIEIYINEKKLNTERGTHKVMTTALNHLKSFQQQGIEYQEVTIAWIQKFVNYLYAEPRYHSRNFAGKMVDMVKQFMRAAQLRGYHRNEAYLNKDFRVKKTPVFDIALNHNDLNAISNADISEYSNLYEISRDYFLLGCYTGLRYSDWDKFQKQYIQTVNTTKYLCVCMQKTTIHVSIPLNTKALEILKKYHYNMPKLSPNQVINRHLKEIAQKSNFTERINKPITRGGQKIVIILAKWQMIGTHTARRTFVTNAFLQGLDTILLANLTGHQSEKQLLKYIKIGQMQKSMIASKHPMFA